MNRSILISIKPEYVEKILNNTKTIEIRKTMPKCELPCKVYIYCTQEKKNNLLAKDNSTGKYRLWYGTYNALNEQVVAEFTLNKVECFTTDYRKNAEQTAQICRRSCVDIDDLIDYECGSPCLYAWHIDDLKIYDEPRELSEFKTTGYCFNSKNITIKQNLMGNYVGNYNENSFCRICKYYDDDWGDCTKTMKTLKRPPQSWCYVEENSDVKD